MNGEQKLIMTIVGMLFVIILVLLFIGQQDCQARRESRAKLVEECLKSGRSPGDCNTIGYQ